MITTTKEMLAVRFADCMAQLKALGLKGEVAVSAGVVMISTSDKLSASIYRRDMKKSAAKLGGVFVENRPSKDFRVFTLAFA